MPIYATSHCHFSELRAGALGVALLLVINAPVAFGQEPRKASSADKPPLFTLDGSVWVAFYDLPSRRFRAIRDAFIQRDFDRVSQDINASITFLQIELQRAPPALQLGLTEQVERLTDINNRLLSRDVSVQDLDPLFARTHWLLAQHYLRLAVHARDSKDYTTMGWLLVAGAHHMERTALWSNARITPSLEQSLVDLYRMADRLRDNPNQRWVRNAKPLVAAAETLQALSEHLERVVLVAPIQPES